jgi:hypothetical protein
MKPMTPAAQSTVLTQEQIDAFTASVLRYLDDACTADEVRALHDQLAADAAHRGLFVRTCLMLGSLRESYAPRRSEWQARSGEGASDDMAADSRADTVVHELSPDDTVHPLPPQQDQA